MKYNLEDCIDFSEITTCLLGAWEYRITTWEYTALAAVKKGLELVALVWITVCGAATHLFWLHEKRWARIRALLNILVHVSQNKSPFCCWKTHFWQLNSVWLLGLSLGENVRMSLIKNIQIFTVFTSAFPFFFSFYLFCNCLLTQQIYKSILRGFFEVVLLPLLS